MADTDPTTTPATEPTTAPTTEPTDWKVEAEKWKHFARKHEADLQKAQRELAKYAQTDPTDQESILRQAEERGRQAALTSLLNERALDKLDVAAARAGVSLDPVRGLLDVSKFLADGQVNSDAISAFVTSYQSGAPVSTPPKPPRAADVGFGPQNSGGAGVGGGQLTREQLRGMSPREIAEAKKSGRLDALMRGQM